jgi:hypothetical protein
MIEEKECSGSRVPLDMSQVKDWAREAGLHKNNHTSEERFAALQSFGERASLFGAEQEKVRLEKLFREAVESLGMTVAMTEQGYQLLKIDGNVIPRPKQ